MHDFISLSAYWDDELPKADKADLADHLADCTLCQGWLSSVAVLTRTIALFPHAPMPADFASRLDARLPDPEAEGSLGAALRSLPTYQAKPDFLSRLMAKLPVCPSFADLSAWVDGELASAEAGELSDHLSVCAPCLKRTAQLHALTGAVRTLPIPVAPPLTAVVLGLGSCPSRTDLSAWLDGELAATGVDLTTHLAACGECAQALVQWQYLGRGIQALPIPVATSPIVLCPDPAELVAEGALPVEIAEHVAGCEPCTVRLANWALLGTAMRLLPAATVPAGFASRMAATVVPACPDRLALHAYHDGEVSITERATLQPHFETCTPCQTMLTSFTRLSAAVTALPGHLAPAGFAFGVAARAPKQAQTPVVTTRHRVGWQWPSAMAAGMLVFGVLAYLQGTGGRPSDSQVAAVPPTQQRVELVAVSMRSEDLLLGESHDVSSPSLLDEWGQ